MRTFKKPGGDIHRIEIEGERITMYSMNSLNEEVKSYYYLLRTQYKTVDELVRGLKKQGYHEERKEDE